MRTSRQYHLSREDSGRGPPADPPPQEAARTAAGWLADWIEQEGPDAAAALIVEPVLGSGMIVARDGYLVAVSGSWVWSTTWSSWPRPSPVATRPWARRQYLRAALRERLGDLWCIGEVRGGGLADGIEYVRERQTREAYPEASEVARSIWEGMLERGFIMPSLRYQGSDLIGDFSILVPPFVISEAQIDEAAAGRGTRAG